MGDAGPLLRTGAAFAPVAADLARGARSLQVRSRREVAGALAGGYRSAFHGGGLEFEEIQLPGGIVVAGDATGDGFVDLVNQENVGKYGDYGRK